MIKEKIIVFIPCKLVSEANNSDHWTKKYKRKKTLQIAVKAALLNRYEFPLPCTVTLQRIGQRMLDADNLIHGCKNIRDQIAQIIIESKIENFVPGVSYSKPIGFYDSDPCITWKYEQRTQKDEFGRKHELGCYVTIEET